LLGIGELCSNLALLHGVNIADGEHGVLDLRHNQDIGLCMLVLTISMDVATGSGLSSKVLTDMTSAIVQMDGKKDCPFTSAYASLLKGTITLQAISV